MKAEDWIALGLTPKTRLSFATILEQALRVHRLRFGRSVRGEHRVELPARTLAQHLLDLLRRRNRLPGEIDLRIASDPLDPPEIRDIPLADAIQSMKAVPLDGDTVRTAREMGICLGDRS